MLIMLVELSPVQLPDQVNTQKDTVNVCAGTYTVYTVQY